MSAERQMRKNDFYRWHHPSEETDIKRLSGTSYWACARIAYFDGEKLTDIYSHIPSNGSFERAYSQYAKNIPIDGSATLEFIANLDDYEWQGDYASYESLCSRHEKSDVLSLAHPNQTRGMVYLKKGATPSNKVRLDFLLSEIERKKREIESLERSINGDYREIESIAGIPGYDIGHI